MKYKFNRPKTAVKFFLILFQLSLFTFWYGNVSTSSALAAPVHMEDSISALSGSAWIDLSPNGLRESTEPALGGVRIYATALDGSFGYITMTDINGRFKFDGLKYGEYEIRYENRAGEVKRAGTIEIDDATASSLYTIPAEPIHSLYLPLIVR